MDVQKRLRTVVLGMVFGGLLLMSAGSAVAEDAYIVRDGEARAEIVLSEKPADSVQYAARELQKYIKKITGATLPIFPESAMSGGEKGGLMQQYPPATERMPVKIYLGQSFHTDRLGVTDDGLDWGAYRMKSGEDWLVLLGHDTEFTPIGIWGRNRGHGQNEAAEKWDKATGEDHHWNNPVGTGLWSKYNGNLDLWAYDQKGTLNAVYGFLRRLGVRWYMPDELGEIVPEKETIAVPEVDRTVKPQFNIRKWSFAKYYLKRAEDELIWALRLGVNNPYGYHNYHGMAPVTRPEEVRKNHPEFYALYNGKRDIESGTPNPCLSSEKLFQENVRYIRFVFDMYDVPAISVWPDDGFTAICQCEKCKGKATPERGRKGLLSDYVWKYVNRVAKEIKKTHPDKLIIGGAYSTYWLPPQNIDELSSNVAVHIVNARRRYNIPQPKLEARREAVREWSRLTDGKVISFMNYGGAANTPRIFAEDIKAHKDLIMGEDMWGPYQGGRLASPGFNHLNYYVSARLWWDADQDVDELLSEYYDRFYGPAAEEMAAFVDYYERHQKEMRGINSAPIIKKALDLFEEAEKQVDSESAYGKRVAMFSEGLEGKREFYDKIKDGRDNPPVFTIRDLSEQISVDGKLDEDFWQELPGELKEIKDGGDVNYPTRFKIGLKGDHLYFGVKCMDEPGDPVNIAETERKDDSSLWYGDAVEFLLETPEHSYYQIAINPEGAVCDLDRRAGLGWRWSAEADIATEINREEGYWTIEARVPFTPSAQDPLHLIIGPEPSRDTPWFFNICRQRVRDEGGETSAFSPTGRKTYHHILEFGKLVKE